MEREATYDSPGHHTRAPFAQRERSSAPSPSPAAHQPVHLATGTLNRAQTSSPGPSSLSRTTLGLQSTPLRSNSSPEQHSNTKDRPASVSSTATPTLAGSSGGTGSSVTLDQDQRHARGTTLGLRDGSGRTAPRIRADPAMTSAFSIKDDRELYMLFLG